MRLVNFFLRRNSPQLLQKCIVVKLNPGAQAWQENKGKKDQVYLNANRNAFIKPNKFLMMFTH